MSSPEGSVIYDTDIDTYCSPESDKHCEIESKKVGLCLYCAMIQNYSQLYFTENNSPTWY